MTPEERQALHSFISAVNLRDIRAVINNESTALHVISALIKIQRFMDWQNASKQKNNERE